LDESIATLKFADNAKSVFIKVNSNQIVANDINLVQKLYKEINNLKQILSLRKKRGNFGDYESVLFKLKSENDKLKQIATNKEGVERLLSENKMLKLELQKLRTMEQLSEGNSSPTHSKENFRESDYSSEVVQKYAKLPMIDNKRDSQSVNKLLSTSTINKSTTNTNLNSFNVANERLKYLEMMERQTDNMVRRELEKIKEMKRKREEEKLTKSIEVCPFFNIENEKIRSN
jgi:hypothetical protein